MVAGVPSTTAGVPIVFTVQAEDRYGNSVTGDQAQLTALVSDGGNASAVIPISYAGAGQYSTRFATTRTGPYILQVVMAGQNVVNSPSSFTVLPGACTPRTPHHLAAGFEALLAVLSLFRLSTGHRGTLTLLFRRCPVQARWTRAARRSAAPSW